MANTKYELSLVSLNVNGLRNKDKRKTLFHWAQTQKCSALFLQETHFTEELVKDIEDEWTGSHILHSFKTNNSGGVSIFLSNDLDVNIIDAVSFSNGRVILSNIEIAKQMFTLVNVYAPNDVKLRNSFFINLDSFVKEYALGELIFGGDFNTVLNPDMDRESSTRLPASIVKNNKLKMVLKNNDLVDIWRYQNPTTKQYTFRQKTPLMKSRLDMFFISRTLVQQVKHCDIRPGYKSDHMAICIKLTNCPKKGKGLWKINNDLLHDNNYIKIVNNLVQELFQNGDLNIGEQWELFKVKIREQSIVYAKRKARAKNQLKTHLLKMIEMYDDDIYRTQYNKILEDESRAAQIRARIQWREEGERNTKFFLGLEKQQQKKQTIYNLKRDNGTVTSNQGEILEMEQSFFEKLYTSKNIQSVKIENYINNTDVPNKLTNEQSNQCDGLITYEEAKNSIFSMKLNKSPGSDGLTVEFYRAFWPIIGKHITDVLNYGYRQRQLVETQRQGVIKLLYKKNDHQLLSNWRPLSLLNTDYKLCAHVLAQRLHKVLPYIINNDQQGYVKKRFIGFNVRLINDVIFYTNRYKNMLNAAVIFADFSKCFDSLELNYTIAAMEKFNFGPGLINWIKTLYNGAQSCISNNGYLSSNFNITRSVRQGCPLSALVFIIAAEMMAINIRNNTKIHGLKVKNKEIKLCQLADDTTLFVSDKPSVDFVIKEIKRFGIVSGLQLNLEKTEGIKLGNFVKNTNSNFCNIKWSDQVKSLGVYFGLNYENTRSLNWNSNADKFKKSLSLWRKRKLTLFGKVVIIKTMALSQLMYLAKCIETPNDEFITMLNKEMYEFLWDGKTDRIQRKVLMANLEEGGISMPNIKLKFCAFKIKWILDISFGEKTSSWNILAREIINKLGLPDLCIFKCNFSKIKYVHNIERMSKFYKDLLEAWLSGGGNQTNDSSFKDIRQQVLWNNENIQFNNKGIFMENWIDSGFIHLNDIMKSQGDILNSLITKNNWIAEYSMIMKAIPREFKNKMFSIDSKNTIVNTRLILKMYDCKSKIYKILGKGTTSKDIYMLLVQKEKKPSYMEKVWLRESSIENKLDLFKKTWLLLKNTKDIKVANFKYKLIHNILPCNKHLFKWKKVASDKCTLCGVVEDYDHLFLKCKRVKQILPQLERYIYNKHKIQIHLSAKDILIFGYKIRHKEYDSFNMWLNKMWYIIFVHYCKNVQIRLDSFKHILL